MYFFVKKVFKITMVFKKYCIAMFHLKISIWKRSAAERSTDEALDGLDPEAVDEGRECFTGFSVSQKLSANVSSAQNASD